MSEKTSSSTGSTTATPQTQVQSPRRIFRALEAKSLKSRSFPTRLADYLTGLSSTPAFLFLNMLFFAAWITWNTGLIPGVPAIDPFPFGLLTMVVSLEAIILSIFVLVSQNRAAQIATLREELHLRINLIAEQEVTKILKILAEMRVKMKIDDDDPELEQMLQDINTSDLEQSITEQLVRADQLIKHGPTFSKREFGPVLKTLLGKK